MFDDLSELATADLLESAAWHRAEVNRLETRLIMHAQVFADRHHPDNCPSRPGRHSYDGRERAVVLGGEGCPEIAEFAPAEFGVMLGVSPRVAADYIGQALALRHRFPFMWARVLNGEATPWKARQIVRSCVKLSEEAASYVDRRVAAIVDTVSPYRLEKIVKAAKMYADAALAQAEAEEAARERGVFVGSSDESGTKSIYIRAASGAVIRFDATIASIAEALKALGHTGSVETRRAEAIGIIADPAYTEELLRQARAQLVALEDSGGSSPVPTDEGRRADVSVVPDAYAETDRDASESDLPDPLDAEPGESVDPEWVRPDDGAEAGQPLEPAARRELDRRLAEIRLAAYTGRSGRPTQPGKTEVYVHLTDFSLATHTGVLRAEGLGPLLASQLSELVGHGPYVVKPVIDLNEQVSVNAYEIPDRIRERVKLAHPVELFPYGTRETNGSIDLDHLEPYDPLGPPGQTNTGNLAPLSRFGHRIKTHARGWAVRRLDAGTIEWTTPHGFHFEVDATGTHRVPEPAHELGRMESP